MWRQHAVASSRRCRCSMLAVSVLLLSMLASSAHGDGGDSAQCVITDGFSSSSCINSTSKSGSQQLVSAQVPLDLRVQWGQAHGYCGEVSVQMIAAHHGIWVGQQVVRDLNRGELLVDAMGSVEKVLDTLGFEHSTWKVPDVHGQRGAKQAGGADWSRHAALFVVWMKQNLAQGRVPIFGAKVVGESDAEYDHIMPAYRIDFWSKGSSSASARSTPAAAAAAAAGSGNSAGANAGGASDAAAAVAIAAAEAGTERKAGATWPEAAAADDGGDDDDGDAGGQQDGQQLPPSPTTSDHPGNKSPLTNANKNAPAGSAWQLPRKAPHQLNSAAPPSAQPPNSQSTDPSLFDGQDVGKLGGDVAEQQVAGWLPSPTHNPVLAAQMRGLYTFSTSDVLTATNNYGGQISRAVGTNGFFADRSNCQFTDTAGGCISSDSPSYAVAMGGLVQPGGRGTLRDLSTEPAVLFQPLRLIITAWSTPAVPANEEPAPKTRATATGYQLDVSRCAAANQTMTVFRFDGYKAFRSTGSRRLLLLGPRPVLANPKSIAELSARCKARGKTCKRAVFVQRARLTVGVKDFGPFSAHGTTYFVCVRGAVPATA